MPVITHRDLVLVGHHSEVGVLQVGTQVRRQLAEAPRFWARLLFVQQALRKWREVLPGLVQDGGDPWRLYPRLLIRCGHRRPWQHGSVTAPGLRSVDQIRQHQLQTLRTGLQVVRRSNPFYHERLPDVQTWDDFERLPFTTKGELVQDQAAHPPFGTNLTFSVDRYVRMHQTSGTGGGQPLRWLDTSESWAWWESIWQKHIYPAAGISAADRIFFAFSFGPFIGFWSAFGGAQRLGALALSGAAMTTIERVHAIRALQITALCCTPTYALRLAETASREGIALASLGIRRSVHAGEPGAGIPATRTAIEAALGATSFDHTGMTELGPTGVSCTERNGVHLFESDFIFEEIDGELVATNLGRWGSPLIRYRTGDRVELTREACACGSPFVKALGGIRGRVDEMFIIRGVNIFPSQVEETVRRHPDVADFVIECRRVRQMDEATIVVEVANEVDTSRVCRTVAEDLRIALGVRLECRAVPIGTLPKSELKAKRLIRVGQR